MAYWGKLACPHYPVRRGASSGTGGPFPAQLEPERRRRSHFAHATCQELTHRFRRFHRLATQRDRSLQSVKSVKSVDDLRVCCTACRETVAIKTARLTLLSARNGL